jgi:hypothetical protein
MAAPTNKWIQPNNPPPPLFLGKKERNLVKQVNDELIERVIGQQILYYPIDIARTNFHPIYGESMDKVFLSPIRVFALIDWDSLETTTNEHGIDRATEITVHFHKKRLTEDQNLYVTEGDFILYGEYYYEIVTWSEPRRLFGQIEHKMEVSAKCVLAREGLFDGK